MLPLPPNHCKVSVAWFHDASPCTLSTLDKTDKDLIEIPSYIVIYRIIVLSTNVILVHIGIPILGYWFCICWLILYHIKRKKIDKSLVIVEKNITFAPRLSYGVMVALQFLVLSVVVRIRLGQQLYLQSPWKSNAFKGFTFWETRLGSLSMAYYDTLLAIIPLILST